MFYGLMPEIKMDWIGLDWIGYEILDKSLIIEWCTECDMDIL